MRIFESDSSRIFLYLGATLIPVWLFYFTAIPCSCSWSRKDFRRLKFIFIFLLWGLGLVLLGSPLAPFDPLFLFRGPFFIFLSSGTLSGVSFLFSSVWFVWCVRQLQDIIILFNTLDWYLRVFFFFFIHLGAVVWIPSLCDLVLHFGQGMGRERNALVRDCILKLKTKMS